jgi:predicted transcriptional regulator
MKEIFESIEARIKTPFFSYFLFSLVAFNWDSFFYLFFDDGKTLIRIDYFKNGTNWTSVFAYPIITACAYTIFYPWLIYILTLSASKPNHLKNNLQIESEHNTLLKKQELENTRSQLLKEMEEELINRAKRDENLGDIENEAIKNKLKDEIEKLRADRDELRDVSFTKNIRAPTPPVSDKLSDQQRKLIILFAQNGGEIPKLDLFQVSNDDKVKTSYYIDDLIEKKYLETNEGGIHTPEKYSLTTKGKKTAIDIGY